MTRLGVFVLVAGVSGMAVAAQTQATPQVPKPFPGAASPQAASPTPTPTPSAADALPIYPASQFLEVLDAGKGQQFHLYGTDAPFAEIVAYYKTTLKNSGRVLFQGPLMHQFDLGRFQEQSMAYPPSVVVKDYTWNGSEGYLHVSGTTSTRYKTIIQIVPATGR